MNTRRRCLAAGVAWPASAWQEVMHAQAKLLGARPQPAPWLEPRNATRYIAS